MKAISIVLFFLGFAFSSAAQTDSVHICKSSSAYRFHKSRACSWYNNCTHSRAKVTEEYARQLGYTPCIPCYGRSTSVGVYKPSSAGNSSQCAAITKKGTRCSRSSRSGGYCWQHGG